MGYTSCPCIGCGNNDKIPYLSKDEPSSSNVAMFDRGTSHTTAIISIPT